MTLRIGPITVQDGAILAPLASISSAPFRQICLEHGCALTVTEMVSSEALIRNTAHALHRLVRAPSERVLVVQLFGSNPETMAKAASIAVEQGQASVIDVNMGCPVRKILGCGAGVALMRDPPLAQTIVQAIVRACGDAAPVTVKIRAGWDDSSVNALEIARRVEDAGAMAITIHARTRDQFHSGTSRWDLICQLKNTVKIPVVGNGGVRSLIIARSMQEQTGCDAIMIGRGALGNPWLFESIRQGVDVRPDLPTRFGVIRRHLGLYIEHAGERVAALEIRKHLGWYLRGLPGSSIVRGRLQSMTNATQIEDTISTFESILARGDAIASPSDFAAPPSLD